MKQFAVDAVTMHSTKLKSFIRSKYNALRYGDMFKNWDELMRLVRVTDSDEADPTTREEESFHQHYHCAMDGIHPLSHVSVSLLDHWHGPHHGTDTESDGKRVESD